MVSAQLKRLFLSLCGQKLKLLFHMASKYMLQFPLPQWPQGARVIEQGRTPVSTLACWAPHHSNTWGLAAQGALRGITSSKDTGILRWYQSTVAPATGARGTTSLAQREEMLHVGARPVRKDTANITGRLWLGHWFIGTHEAPSECPNFMGDFFRGWSFCIISKARNLSYYYEYGPIWIQKVETFRFYLLYILVNIWNKANQCSY